MNTIANDATSMRRHNQRYDAEDRVATDAARAPAGANTLSLEDTQAVLHELRVHQMELEMQNEELRLTQVDLDAARARYFDLYDLAPVGYCTLSAQGLILQANLTAATLLGLSREALVHLPLTRFVQASEQDTYYLYCRKLLDTGDATSCELGMTRHGGTSFWVHMVANRAPDEHGAPVLRMVLSDITARRLAQAELRIAATAFESQQGIVVTDANEVILRVNPAFSAITGYTAEDAVGQTPRLLSAGHHDPAFFAAMWATIAASGSWHGEIWNRRKNGERFPLWLTITAVQDDSGHPTHYVSSFVDISLRKAAEEQITKLAFYDLLTGLPNRRLLMDRLEQALAASERHRRHGALMFIDLDNFKTINDTLGHSQGDLLLVQVAARLSASVREGDTVARLGGDEFVVMLLDLCEDAVAAAAQAESVAGQVQKALHCPYLLGVHKYHCTASIGITLFADQQLAIDELLKRADLSMYEAKEAGRDTLRFFEPQMQSAVTERAEVEAGLRVAIEQGQLLLHYQAQVTAGAKLTGVEALVRWQHHERGLVMAHEIIPLAEKTGLILPLGQWVLDTACDQLALWASDAEMCELSMAVNVSARQFHQSDFVEQVQASLTRSGANPHRLKLELTESVLLNKLNEVVGKMTALKALGVSFALDDFGLGYSLLSYLRRLPLDQLKIDQSFVHDLMSDPNGAVIARAIVALGGSLGLQVIAEGVETAEQRDTLASMGCDAYQGYYFGRPGPVSSLPSLLLNMPSSPCQ